MRAFSVCVCDASARAGNVCQLMRLGYIVHMAYPQPRRMEIERVCDPRCPLPTYRLIAYDAPSFAFRRQTVYLSYEGSALFSVSIAVPRKSSGWVMAMDG